MGIPKISGRRAFCATFLSQFPPTERSESMYTRIVETTSKHGKARELCQTIDDKVLPILRKQNGFVDEVVMVSDTEPNRVTAISFWKTREDAQRYQREQFDNVKKTMQHVLEGDPNVRTFDVHTSTAHRVKAEKAEQAA
jgi:heme-degrading monooxygenase HmoA